NVEHQRPRPPALAQPLGPFDQQRTIVKIIVEPQFDQLIRILDPIEIDMRDGQIDLGRRIGLDDCEGRARRLARQPARLQHRACERRLAGTEVPRKQNDIARHQPRPDRRADPPRVTEVVAGLEIRHAPRGRLIRTSVPCPCSLTTSIVPPCAATSWRARARPIPPVAVPACCPLATAAAASGIPGPLSDTMMSTPRASPSAWSSTRAPD